MEDNIKEEKRQAKLQDRAYVDYRKAEILHDIKPKTKAFNLKKFDDSFPRPNKKKEANMEFGELMHKYLMMRPDGRFATWLGKKPAEKKAKVGAKRGKEPNENKGGIVMKIAAVMPMQPKESAAEKAASKKANKKKKQNIPSKRDVATPKSPTRRVIDEEEEAMEQKKDEGWSKVVGEPHKANANRRKMPMPDNKPFWLVGDAIVPEEENESYVDAEMVGEYMANPGDSKFPTNSYEREKFFVTTPAPQKLWTELKQFGDKRLVIGNTLKSLLESSADRMGISKDRIDNEHKLLLKWDTTTKCIDYAMDVKDLEKTGIYEGKLQNNRKEDAKTE